MWKWTIPNKKTRSNKNHLWIVWIFCLIPVWLCDRKRTCAGTSNYLGPGKFLTRDAQRCMYRWPNALLWRTWPNPQTDSVKHETLLSWGSSFSPLRTPKYTPSCSGFCRAEAYPASEIHWTDVFMCVEDLVHSNLKRVHVAAWYAERSTCNRRLST